jgi:hypothetical protein
MGGVASSGSLGGAWLAGPWSLVGSGASGAVARAPLSREKLARLERTLGDRVPRDANGDPEENAGVGQVLEPLEPSSIRKSRTSTSPCSLWELMARRSERRKRSSSTRRSLFRISASVGAAPSISTATTKPDERYTRWVRPESSASSRVPEAPARWSVPSRSPSVVILRRPGRFMLDVASRAGEPGPTSSFTER